MICKTEVLIIGAGAAGLMAGRLLAKAGKKVLILEARNRCGGRIHTVDDEDFFNYEELGAEFIHGDLAVTLNLLKDAGISYKSATAEMWHFSDGHFNKDSQFVDGWDKLISRLTKLKRDKTIEDFLQDEFSEAKYEGMRTSVRKFVAGYDTADTSKASAFALRREWQSEDEGAQHRIKGGYKAMINYLEDEIKQAGGEIYLNSVVKNILWKSGLLRITTNDSTVFEADKLIVAIPLGVLQADKSAEGAVVFDPPIPGYDKAIQKMGFGAVIKILLEFDELFWEDKTAEKIAGKSLKGMGYLFSDEKIPTWWTQVPYPAPVLTGWIGGPEAAEKRNDNDLEILQQSLESLSNIFKREIGELKNKLVSFKIINWTNEPFTLGSYAYDTVEAPAIRKVLSTPVAGTIFFAGEYLYDGPAMGTVEAALTSGIEAAKRIIDVYANVI